MEIVTLADVDKQIEALLPILKSYDIGDVVYIIKQYLVRYNIRYFVESNDVFGKIKYMDDWIKRKYQTEMIDDDMIYSMIKGNRVWWMNVYSIKFLYDELFNHEPNDKSLVPHVFMTGIYRLIHTRKHYYNDIYSAKDNKLSVIEWDTGKDVIFHINPDI
jgi:hypothetical protein